MYEESVVSTESVLTTKHGLIGAVGSFVGFSSGYDTERLFCDRNGCERKIDLAGS